MKNLLLISNILYDNEEVIEYAARFCKYYKTKLHILHVSTDTRPVLVSSPNYFNEFEIDFEKNISWSHLEKITSVTSKYLTREFVNVKIDSGNEETILNDFVHDNFIDMIMLSLKDLDENEELADYKNLLFNVIDTPLIVIPEYQVFEPLIKFDFLTTHSRFDLEDLEKLNEIFPEMELTLTHYESDNVDDGHKLKAKKWVDYAKEKLGKDDIKYELIHEDIKKHIRVENYAQVSRYDAFVFTARKRNFWSRLFDPSTTLGFLAELEIPSIIFKVDQKEH